MQYQMRSEKWNEWAEWNKRFDKDFEKQCYDLIKLLGINFGPADVNIRLKGRWWLS